MNTKNIFDSILESVKSSSCTAVQGLKEEQVAAKQLHRFREGADHPEFFALVTEVGEKDCTIVPGSLDAYEAGTGDYVLPRSVMGDYVSLCVELEQKVPVESLGNAFARLDDDSFARVAETIARYKGGSVNNAEPFRPAFPFVGDLDSRLLTRGYLKSVVDESVQSVRLLVMGKELKERIRIALEGIAQRLGEAADAIFAAPAFEPALAAGEEEKYTSQVFKVDGVPGVELEFEYADGAASMMGRVYRDGNVSEELDGCSLIDEAGTELGTITKGICRLALSKTEAGRRIVVLDCRKDEQALYALVR